MEQAHINTVATATTPDGELNSLTPPTGKSWRQLATTAVVVLLAAGGLSIPTSRFIADYNSEEQKLSRLLQRTDLPLTSPVLDKKYAELEPSTAAIFAGFAYYKDEDFFVQGNFSPIYGSILKLLASDNYPSKNNDPALDLDGGREEWGKLVFGYTPQCRPNCAFKMLMRHSLLFDNNRPPIDQLTEEHGADSEVVKAAKHLKPIPYEKQYLNELTDLCLTAIVKEAAVDGNDKQNLFARRLETALQDEAKDKGLKQIENFFNNLDLADRLPPQRFVDFIKETGLDQSTRLRALLEKRAKESSLHAKIVEALPPITEAVQPLPWSEIVRPLVRNKADQDLERFKLMLDQIMESLDQFDQDDQNHPLP